MLKGCLSVKCLQFSTILLQLRPARRSLVCARNAASLASNPLISNSTDLKFRGVKADHVEEAIPSIISKIESDFQEFESRLAGKKIPRV